ncbi:MAG: cobalt-precorrin-4/precorrin-4 C(11)-methyltransferase [Deltaproteobacteria bacterium]|nr:cobalt-precorrin-4/precorrin-4 C(11)-methyltransferase [Deltaproteobacteria bacterium]
MKEKKCQVYFVGAGPGDPELITIKGRKCIEQADLVVRDSSSMTLDQTHALMVETVRGGGTVARVHTGDPSLYGAVREQAILLEREGIPYEIVPGVTAATAAAASARVSFTLPEKVQTLIITRLEGRTPVPEKERLKELSRHNASMALYLSASDPEGIAEGLLAGGYDAKTPVVTAYRVGWPDELILRSRVSTLVETVRTAGIRRQAVFLVLPGQEEEPVSSRLYCPDFLHGFRK